MKNIYAKIFLLPLILCGAIAVSMGQSYAPFGGTFTPQGEYHILLVYAGFTNDNDPAAPDYVDANNVWSAEDEFPSYHGEMFYDDIASFDPNATDATLSNFYYQMSINSPNPLKIVAHTLPTRINVPASNYRNNNPDDAIDDGWSYYFKQVFNKIKTTYPDEPYTNYDQRINNPNYKFDNSPLAKDHHIDMVVVMFRYKGNDRLPYQTTVPFANDYGQSALFSSSSKIAVGNSSIPDTISTGISLCRAWDEAKAMRSFFLHENAHDMYDMGHLFGANKTMGNKFYTTNGWGMMGTSTKLLYSANAWERWVLGWDDIKHDLKGLNAVNGVYKIQDYVTTGDAIRLEIPGSLGTQHLWLENHQGVHTVFDNRDAWNSVHIYGNKPRGLLAYVEGITSTRNQPPSVFNLDDNNGIRTLSAAGNYDYVIPNTFTTPWQGGENPTFDFSLGAENPIAGYSDVSEIRMDYTGTDLQASGSMVAIPDGEITTLHNHGNLGGQYERALNYMRDGVLSFPSMGANIGFQVGDKMDLGSNPMLTNTPTFITDKTPNLDMLSPYYLNGISIEVISVDDDTHEMEVRIKFNDTQLRNDTRYTGNIVLPNVQSVANGADLDVMPGVTLRIDKSGTANKRFERTPGSGDFVNPTIFTVQDYSLMHIDHDATVIVENESTLKLNPRSILEVHENGVLRIKSGCKLILENEADLIVHRDGQVIIEDGAELIIKNNLPAHGLMIGNNSTVYQTAELKVFGTIKIEDGATFSNIGDGFISFYGNGSINFGDNTEIDLKGRTQSDELIRLGNGVTLELDANSTSIADCWINMAQTSKIILNKNKDAQGIAGDYSFSNITVNGGANFNSNVVEAVGTGDFSILGSEFSGMEKGLYLKTPKGTLTARNTEFRDCEIGLEILGSISTNNLLRDCQFISNSTGLKLNAVPSITLNTTNIKQSTVGIESSGVNYLVLEDKTKIHLCNKGVVAEASNVFLRSAAQISQNTVGVEMINPAHKPKIFAMGDDGTCGYVTGNGKGITGKNIFLDIDAEDHTTAIFGIGAQIVPNHFEDNGLIFEVIIEENGASPITHSLDAKGNYWGAPTVVGNVNNPIFKPFNPKAPFDHFQIYYVDGFNPQKKYQVDLSEQCVRGTSSWCSVCDDYFPIRRPGPHPPFSQILKNCTLDDQLSVEEQFYAGYQEFVVKDYDKAIPLLEVAAEIPFRTKTPKLNSHCENLIRIAEILTEKFKNGGDNVSEFENPHKLKVTPNPVHGNFIAEYDLVEKTAGQLIIKDAITGLVQVTEQIDNSAKSKQVNVSGLSYGNYILELRGVNGEYLNSEHVLIY